MSKIESAKRKQNTEEFCRGILVISVKLPLKNSPPEAFLHMENSPRGKFPH